MVNGTIAASASSQPQAGNPVLAMVTEASVPNFSISALLPRNLIAGLIPLNKYHDLLDKYTAPPSYEDRACFEARVQVKKLCFEHHMFRNCAAENECEFDHDPIDPKLQHVLQYTLKEKPCGEKGDCRRLRCYRGHLCQKDNCRSFDNGCKLKRSRLGQG